MGHPVDCTIFCDTQLILYISFRYNLDLLGIKYKHVAAVDGRTLNQDYIDLHGIKVIIIIVIINNDKCPLYI